MAPSHLTRFAAILISISVKKYLVNVPFADEDSPMWRSRPSVHARGDPQVHGAKAWLHQGEPGLPQVRQRAGRAHWGGEEGLLAGLNLEFVMILIFRKYFSVFSIFNIF